MPAQNLARDEAGNIWEVDAQGNPVRLAQPSQSGPNVVVPAAPPEPKFIPDHPGYVLTPGGGAAPIPGLPPEAPKPTFVPDKPGYVMGPGGTATPIPGIPQADINPQVRANAIQQFNYAKQLEDVADQLNQLYLQGPGGTKGLEGFKDYLPYATNKNFDAAANKSRGIVGQALGFTGGQLNTEREAERAVGPYIPQAGDFDSTIQQKIQSMRDLAGNARQNAIQTLGGVPDANGNIVPEQKANQSAALPPITGAQGDQVTGATGKSRDVIDPILRATGQKVGSMLAAGVSDAKIIDFLRQSGVNPSDTNVARALQFRKTDDFKRWQRANPGTAYPIGPEFYIRQVPMSDVRSLLNKGAANDVVGAALAAPVASANAISGGRLDSLVSDPEAARTGMALLRGAHPYSSFAGDIAGQASLEAAAGLIPGVQPLMLSKIGRRGADALYGAYSGSGESDDNPGGGALEGAASGLGFGMLGRGFQRGVGRTMTGIQNANLGYLNSLGVPLSVGRIARGANNDFGKAVGGVEDRLAGLPGMDAVIGDVRQAGDQAFSLAGMRQIDPSITKAGHEGLAQAYAAEDAAYGKLAPVRIGVDQPFEQALTAVEQSAKGLNHHAADVESVIKDIRSQIANGEMTGKGYQTAIQAIRGTASTLNDDVGGHADRLLGSLEKSVMDLGNRQSGTVGADLAAANALHGRIKIMQDALKKPISQKAGEVVSPTALNASSIGQTTRFGGIRKALSPDRPFYDLTTAGLDVMPNPTPDSGTAGRLAVLGALAKGGIGLGGLLGAGLGGEDRVGGGTEGAGMGLGGGLALAGLLMAPYSKTGQKILQKSLLAERPRAIQKIGNYLINANPKYAGMFGSALGRDYFFQPELGQ